MRWRWPWRARREAHRDPEAARALQESKRRLREAHTVTPVVDALVAALDRQGQINNFQARIAAAYRERR